MPVPDKPLPDTPEDNYLSLPHADLMTQVHQATYSPSPLLRVLQDPTLMPTESSQNLKDKSTRRRASRSPGRRCDHKSPMVAAIAIAEEERQGRHLKALLRAAGEHLEQETRRAAEATLRAEFAERREREALSRANDAEAKNEELQYEVTHLERDIRSYQMQLEASELAMKRLQEDLAEARREIDEIERGERKAQEQVQRYHMVMQDYEREQTTKMQEVANNWYEDGREDGYEEGYDIGYEDGRKHGLRKGIKQGRKEVLQGARAMDEGHRNERRNAVPEGVFDRIVAENGNDTDGTHRDERTRRRAEAIYESDGHSEPSQQTSFDG